MEMVSNTGSLNGKVRGNCSACSVEHFIAGLKSMFGTLTMLAEAELSPRTHLCYFTLQRRAAHTPPLLRARAPTPERHEMNANVGF